MCILFSSHHSYYIFNANSKRFLKTYCIKPQTITLSVPQCAVTSEYHQTIYPAQITAAYLSPHSPIITVRSASQRVSHIQAANIAAQYKPFIGQQMACGISLHTDNIGCMLPTGERDRAERGRLERRKGLHPLPKGERCKREIVEDEGMSAGTQWGWHERQKIYLQQVPDR